MGDGIRQRDRRDRERRSSFVGSLRARSTIGTSVASRRYSPVSTKVMSGSNHSSPHVSPRPQSSTERARTRPHEPDADHEHERCDDRGLHGSPVRNARVPHVLVAGRRVLHHDPPEALQRIGQMGPEALLDLEADRPVPGLDLLNREEDEKTPRRARPEQPALDRTSRADAGRRAAGSTTRPRPASAPIRPGTSARRHRRRPQQVPIDDAP